MLERKVYNNDDITFFSGCNTLSHSGLVNINIRKRMFYPLIENSENLCLNSFVRIESF